MDTYLTFLSCILILMQVTLMKITRKDHILILRRSLFIVIQVMVKIGKLALLLTHLPYNNLIVKCMVKVKSLRPLQTYITNRVPNKHPIPRRTLKLQVNLCHNHHRGRLTTHQGLRSTILLPNLFRKMNLAILDSSNPTHAQVLIVNTQKYTDIDASKILFQPFSCAIFTPYF